MKFERKWFASHTPIVSIRMCTTERIAQHNFPPFNAIDVRDFDVEQSADSDVISGTKDVVNDLRDMRVEPVEMEIYGESVRVVDDVRWANEHVKRIP